MRWTKCHHIYFRLNSRWFNAPNCATSIPIKNTWSTLSFLLENSLSKPPGCPNFESPLAPIVELRSFCSSTKTTSNPFGANTKVFRIIEIYHCIKFCPIPSTTTLQFRGQTFRILKREFQISSHSRYEIQIPWAGR